MSKRSRAKNKMKKIVNSNDAMNGQIDNNLTSFVQGTGNPYGSTQIMQTDTMFNNLRYYFVSNMRQLLSQSYCEHGVVKNFVDVPVDDAFRGGVDIKTAMLDPDEIEFLKTKVEAEGAYNEVAQFFKWDRLFGGAGLVYMTGQKHDTPLVKTQAALQGMEVKAVDMWELYDATHSNDESRRMEISLDKEFKYNFYGLDLHNTRVIPLKGIVPPSFVRPRFRGWGMSIIEDVVSSINQYFKTKNLTFEVLDEFKLDIFKIKNFNTTLLTPGGTEKILKRTALANQQKNFQNALTMDMEDEHESKQLNFAGLSEIMGDIRIQLASDLRMPMTKLFGISSAGFNSGEDDIENYNTMVEGTVRSKAKFVLIDVYRMFAIREFGIDPTDLHVEFTPLRVMSGEQEEKIKDSKLNRIVQANDKGFCSIKEAKESINKDDLLGVVVSMSDESLTEDTKETDTETEDSTGLELVEDTTADQA